MFKLFHDYVKSISNLIFNNYKMSDDLIRFLQCPYCQMYMEIPIKEINCAIYRHAVIKATGQQLYPHASKEVCNKLVRLKLIYGCGNPFRVKRNSQNRLFAEKCGYL
jgi:hypothetical protein